MVSLARQLGLSEDLVREAGLAGLLHDVGKMTMPVEVLNKPGSLTDAEFVVMRSHPERGHALLLAAGSIPASALDVCLHHHEKYDGSGYPYRLQGEAISLFARMGAVCDVYDAITSNRPYKKAWNPAESLARMAQWTGHFDTPGVSRLRTLGGHLSARLFGAAGIRPARCGDRPAPGKTHRTAGASVLLGKGQDANPAAGPRSLSAGCE